MTNPERRDLEDATLHAKVPLPVACSLSGPDLAQRRRELAGDVFGRALEVGELNDGYEFAFPGSTGWATRLVELTEAGRACCPFSAFELRSEPNGGRISLRVQMPEGKKELVKAEPVEAGPSETSTKTEVRP